MWYHFQFDSKANPYIAKTKEEADRKIRAWKRKGYYVRKIREGFYYVEDFQPKCTPRF